MNPGEGSVLPDLWPVPRPPSPQPPHLHPRSPSTHCAPTIFCETELIGVLHEETVALSVWTMTAVAETNSGFLYYLAWVSQ